MNDLKEIAAKNIKIQRKKQKMTQAQLAERAELSTQYISLIETGRRKLSLNSIYSIAIALHVSLDVIMEIEVNTSDSEIDEIFSDCTFNERHIMLEILRSTKKSLKD